MPCERPPRARVEPRRRYVGDDDREPEHGGSDAVGDAEVGPEGQRSPGPRAKAGNIPPWRRRPRARAGRRAGPPLRRARPRSRPLHRRSREPAPRASRVPGRRARPGTRSPPPRSATCIRTARCARRSCTRGKRSRRRNARRAGRPRRLRRRAPSSEPAALAMSVAANGITTSSASPTRQAAMASGGASARRAKIAPPETASSAIPSTR